MCLLGETITPKWLWYNCLSHVSLSALKHIFGANMVDKLSNFNNPTTPCEGCLARKQTSNPYPTKTTFKAKRRLEFVHGDICGPILPTKPTYNRYFMNTA